MELETEISSVVQTKQKQNVGIELNSQNKIFHITNTKTQEIFGSEQKSKPFYFESLTQYPLTWEYPCERCGYKFNTSPVFYPMKYHILKKQWILSDRAFCSFVCLKGFIIDSSFSNNKEEIPMTCTFYETIFHLIIENIPYISLRSLKSRSPIGHLDENEYRKMCQETSIFLQVDPKTGKNRIQLFSNSDENTNNNHKLFISKPNEYSIHFIQSIVDKNTPFSFVETWLEEKPKQIKQRDPRNPISADKQQAFQESLRQLQTETIKKKKNNSLD